MEKLVELYKGKEARVSTFNIWEGFGYYEHRTLKMVIFKNRELFEKKGMLFTATTVAANTKKKRGGQEQGYLLNEEQFTLLVVLAKNTKESVELKVRVVDEFFRMRKTLANLSNIRLSEEWKEARKDGKIVYTQKTDIIKKFIDYATEQGSKSASMYYKNLADMENKALFILEQKYPNVREVLNIKQLMQVSTADQIVEKALEDGMDIELPYKEIYLLAKDRVIKFSEIIGKSLVIDSVEKNLLPQ